MKSLLVILFALLLAGCYPAYTQHYVVVATPAEQTHVDPATGETVVDTTMTYSYQEIPTYDPYPYYGFGWYGNWNYYPNYYRPRIYGGFYWRPFAHRTYPPIVTPRATFHYNHQNFMHQPSYKGTANTAPRGGGQSRSSGGMRGRR